LVGAAELIEIELGTGEFGNAACRGVIGERVRGGRRSERRGRRLFRGRVGAAANPGVDVIKRGASRAGAVERQGSHKALPAAVDVAGRPSPNRYVIGSAGRGIPLAGHKLRKGAETRTSAPACSILANATGPLESASATRRVA